MRSQDASRFSSIRVSWQTAIGFRLPEEFIATDEYQWTQMEENAVFSF
jgi:hypothetical protein